MTKGRAEKRCRALNSICQNPHIEYHTVGSGQQDWYVLQTYRDPKTGSIFEGVAAY